MRTLIALRVLTYCCIAIPASAQATFADLHVKGKPTVYVTNLLGRETKGKLVEVRDAVITVHTRQAIRTFTPDEVLLIERKGDSLKNGAIWGIILGAYCALVCGQGVASGREYAGVVAYNFSLPIAVDAVLPGRTRIWPVTKRKMP
jgi:hypothetical protein